MWWRAANAAYEAKCLAEWPYLEPWHKAWIIAIVEEKVEIANNSGS